METIFKTDLLTRICCSRQVRKCVLLGGEALMAAKAGPVLFRQKVWGSSCDPSTTTYVTLSRQMHHASGSLPHL